MLTTRITINESVDLLVAAAATGNRNLQMSGDPHYQPKDLQLYLGYDQRVGWQILVEWFWLMTLAAEGVMPAENAALLTPELLLNLLRRITTTRVTALEREKTKHDILALLIWMRRYLPRPLYPYLHLGLTSYDIISSAYALQLRHTFDYVFWPKLRNVDELWRKRIGENAEVLQIGRTHLQDALPVTVGAWLAPLHHRFAECARNADSLVRQIPGKLSGAVGTHGALTALVPGINLEATGLELLGLPSAKPSTQIPPPEAMARFYHEITLLSAALANLGDDVRHLQSSAIGEVNTVSSTSSTMSHKQANPIAAEQLEGMHVSVRCEYLKVLETLGSTLQRDLRYSNVMRGYGAILVFAFQQLSGTERILKSLAVNRERCRKNFDRNGKLVVGELLHLFLQKSGYPEAHKFVNQKIVPRARASGNDLATEMDLYVRHSRSRQLRSIWAEVPDHIRHLLAHSEEYLGDAKEIAERETENRL